MVTNRNLPEPELLVDLPCQTGEGPLWHEAEKKIYWTDIPRGRIFRCRCDGGDLEEFDVGVPVGGFTIQEDDDLLLFMQGGAVRKWRHGNFTGTVIDGVPSERDSRFNDVIADPAGRVYCGTMSSPSHGGRMYRLDLDGTLVLLRENMKTPNGMGFSPDQSFFYQNDSGNSRTYRYRYHRQTGGLGDPEVIFQIDPNTPAGRPDGMTVDVEGGVWTARWDGGRVVRHAPDGSPMEEILFPVKKVSSLTIAGEDRQTAFFTTAGGNNRGRDEGELAGSLFRCRPMPVPGLTEFRSRVMIP